MLFEEHPRNEGKNGLKRGKVFSWVSICMATMHTKRLHFLNSFLIIIMYIYHALINALSAHMIHINLNMIFYTHVKHSPTKTIYTHTHTHTLTVAETGY